MFWKPGHTSDRSGFTLFELLVVVALLTVLISLAVPSVTSMLGRQKFQEQAGQVEQFLSNVRREAAMSGQPQWIRFASQGQFLIAGKLGDPMASSLELPEGVEFSRSETIEKLESDQLGSLGLKGADVSWSPEFLFFSDGTADDLQLKMTNAEKRFYEIQVRGLTGQVLVRIGNLSQRDEP